MSHSLVRIGSSLACCLTMAVTAAGGASALSAASAMEVASVHLSQCVQHGIVAAQVKACSLHERNWQHRWKQKGTGLGYQAGSECSHTAQSIHERLSAYRVQARGIQRHEQQTAIPKRHMPDAVRPGFSNNQAIHPCKDPDGIRLAYLFWCLADRTVKVFDCDC